MISKELLSEVAPKFDFHDDITIDENELVFWKDGEMHCDVNIYELAHKCKGWARDRDYNLITILSGAEYECFDFMWDYNGCDAFKADTEPEAIFKACEWILEQKATTLLSSS